MAMNQAEKNNLLSRLALFATTLIWGSSFVILKNTINEVPTFYVLAIRFTVAAALMLILGFKDLKKIDRNYIKGGVIMGVFMFIAYVLQTYGLFYTTPGKNAFLTTTYCVITPFLYWVTAKKKPEINNVVAAGVCLAGVCLVSQVNELSVNLGDMLTICCGLFFALHILAINKYVEGRSIAMLTMIQFLTAGLLAWIFGLSTEPFPTAISSTSLWSLAYLSVMCTAVCYLLQTFGQRYASPSSTALIMTLESVFGAIISVALGYENLTFGVVVGFVLIFAAVILSEAGGSLFRWKKAGIT